MSLNGCHLVFHPHAYPGVIARSAATWQSRRRSKRGAPKYVRPRCKPPLSLRAKRGNPATEAKPVRPRISTPQTNPLCHCERSAAIPPPKPSRCAHAYPPLKRTPSVIASKARQSRNRSQAGVPTHVHPSNEPTMSLRAKRGNPVTEAKPVRRQMFNLIEIATSLSPSQ